MKPLVERLLDRCVDVDGCCFQGGTDGTGYVQVTDRGVRLRGHHVTWEFFIGPWPSGLTFDHLCRVRNCVNPWHGDPVPLAVNIRRASELITTCRRGHAFDAHNGMQRLCRTCRRESNRTYRLRRKQATS